MNRTYTPFLRFLVLMLAFLGATGTASASHFYGADLFYTHVSGNTYKVTLRAYGDCAGSSFFYFPTSTPQVSVIIDPNNIIYTNLTLSLEGPGVEVSPVCASQISSTACNGGSNPGVTQFTYSAQVTLNSTSNLWRFKFSGNMGGNNQAGRSNSITNVLSGTTLGLEATLNRTQGPNSSPNYTTIPTPFFCVNNAQGYNPGAVDPNADSLSFNLVTGLDGVAASSGFVSYVAPYTAGNPLGSAVPLVFSTTNGQINFTPNITQKSLVVSQVTEYKNGQVTGTSMREMTFVVLSSCNNTAPVGLPTNAVGSSILDATTIKACASSGTISFSLNPTDVNGDSIDVTYAGLPAGATLTIAGNGTTAPLGNFSWNINGVAPGNYNFFVTYTDRGCPLSSRRTTAYTVRIAPRPTYTFALQTAATCAAKGKFTLTPSGPDPRTVVIQFGLATVLSYSNRTTPILDSLAPGFYTVTSTDTAGCTASLTFTIAAPTPITLNYTTMAPTCSGGSNGSVNLVPGNATSPVTISFNGGAFGTATTFNNLTPGTYSAIILDGRACTLNAIVVVPDTLGIVAGFTRALPPCNAFASGEISLNAFGGLAPYTYALGGGSYTASGSFTGLAAGTYILHIKDGRGCTKDTTVLLPDSIKVGAVVTVDSVQCFGSTDGQVTLSGNGTNAPPYTYAAGSGSFVSSGVFSGLGAGNTVFHVKDVNGCFLDTAVLLKNPPKITAQLLTDSVLCNNTPTGKITVLASGGSGALAYSQDGISYTSFNVFTSLPAGPYSIRVKDSRGCTGTFDTLVRQPTALVLSYVAASPLCNGETNGSFTLTGMGAVPGYTYAFNNGAFGPTNVYTGLGAGTFTLRVKDAKGCITDSVATLTTPAKMSLNATQKQSTCNSLANGAINIVGSGGTPPYTFSKNGGSYTTTTFFTGLAAGFYTFRMKDAKGCLKDTSFNVTDSIQVRATVFTTPALCRDSLNGTITLIGNSGVAPYTYTFNGSLNNTTGLFTGIGAQTWPVRVTDVLGCLYDTIAQVAQPLKLQTQLLLTQPACFGDANGVITLNATGGTAPYRWGKGGSTPGSATSFGGLAAGTYNISLRDTNNCKADTTVTLTEPTPFFLTGVVPTAVSCFGSADGSVQVTATGGTLPYAYAVDAAPFGTASTLSNLAPGNHLVRVKDSRGCTKDTSVTITEPLRLGILFSLTQPTCAGFTDGGVEWAGTGGTPPYQFAINSGSFSNTGVATSLAAGTYTLQIRDSKGCLNSVDVKLEGYPDIAIERVSMTPVRCFGEATGSVLIVASGGNPPLTYQLSAPLPARAATPNSRIDSLAIGEYRFTVIDDKGCRKDASATVTQPDSLIVKGEVVLNDCVGLDDNGALQTAVKGGTQPYKYLWYGAGNISLESGSQVQGLPNGNYAVRVVDSNGCMAATTLSITYENCCKPFVPNAFTPNNDGKNDTWQVLYKGDMELERAAVYNRYGQLIFESRDKMQAWDGTFRGVPADVGTYFFTVRVKCGNVAPFPLEYKGDITLLR